MSTVTTQQVVSSVYMLLRRPSQQKLPYTDVLTRLNALLRGYMQDQNLNGRQQRTAIADVTFTEDTIDYRVSVPGVEDFEPLRLEYSPDYTNANSAWYEMQIVPFEAWDKHYSRPQPSASFYGSPTMGGVKAKLNLDWQDFSRSSFRLSYRQPLVAVLQMGDRPPLPADFMPMVEYDLAVDCMSIVNDNSPEWLGWVAATKPDYIARVQDWRTKWTDYLETSQEPVTQFIKPYNSFRYTSRRNRRAYLPIQ